MKQSEVAHSLNRVAQADERLLQADEWMQTVTDLGIAQHFAAAREYLDRYPELGKASDPGEPVDAVSARLASELADGTTTPAEAHEALRKAEMTNSASYQATIAKARRNAGVRAFLAFNLGADRLHEILAALTRETVEAITADAAPIGREITTLDQAAAAGPHVAAAWVKVRDHLTRLNRIRNLGAGWRNNEFLPTAGRWEQGNYRHDDFMWADPENLTPRRGEDHVAWFLQNLRDGRGPGYYTIDEVDQYRARVLAADTAANSTPTRPAEAAPVW